MCLLFFGGRAVQSYLWSNRAIQLHRAAHPPSSSAAAASPPSPSAAAAAGDDVVKMPDFSHLEQVRVCV